MTIFSHANWSGGEFLALYVVLLMGAIYTGFAIPHYLRARGRKAGALEHEQTAYLAGGRERYAELVATRLRLDRMRVSQQLNARADLAVPADGNGSDV